MKIKNFTIRKIFNILISAGFVFLLIQAYAADNEKLLISQNQSQKDMLEVISNTKKSSALREKTYSRLISESKGWDLGRLTESTDQLYSYTKEQVRTSKLTRQQIKLLSQLVVVEKEMASSSKTGVPNRDLSFLNNVALDNNENFSVRLESIRAIGQTNPKNGGDTLAKIINQPAEYSNPELIRQAVLALELVEGESATDAIGQILQETTNPKIFGTAAYTLGKIADERALELLILNEERFKDSGAVGAAIIELDDVIYNILSEPNNQKLNYAIRATYYLWTEDQRKQYLPLLKNLLSTAPHDSRELVLIRLIDESKKMTLEEEQLFLRSLLPIVESQLQLREHIMYINDRLSAKLIQPSSQSSIPTP